MVFNADAFTIFLWLTIGGAASVIVGFAYIIDAVEEM